MICDMPPYYGKLDFFYGTGYPFMRDGILTAFNTDPERTYFTVNGVNYIVQNENMVIVVCGNGHFTILYNADPIFRDGFNSYP